MQVNAQRNLSFSISLLMKMNNSRECVRLLTLGVHVSMQRPCKRYVKPARHCDLVVLPLYFPACHEEMLHLPSGDFTNTTV